MRFILISIISLSCLQNSFAQNEFVSCPIENEGLLQANESLVDLVETVQMGNSQLTQGHRVSYRPLILEDLLCEKSTTPYCLTSLDAKRELIVLFNQYKNADNGTFQAKQLALRKGLKLLADHARVRDLPYSDLKKITQLVLGLREARTKEYLVNEDILLDLYDLLSAYRFNQFLAAQDELKKYIDRIDKKSAGPKLPEIWVRDITELILYHPKANARALYLIADSMGKTGKRDVEYQSHPEQINYRKKLRDSGPIIQSSLLVSSLLEKSQLLDKNQDKSTQALALSAIKKIVDNGKYLSKNLRQRYNNQIKTMAKERSLALTELPDAPQIDYAPVDIYGPGAPDFVYADFMNELNKYDGKPYWDPDDDNITLGDVAYAPIGLITGIGEGFLGVFFQMFTSDKAKENAIRENVVEKGFVEPMLYQNCLMTVPKQLEEDQLSIQVKEEFGGPEITEKLLQRYYEELAIYENSLLPSDQKKKKWTKLEKRKKFFTMGSLDVDIKDRNNDLLNRISDRIVNFKSLLGIQPLKGKQKVLSAAYMVFSYEIALCQMQEGLGEAKRPSNDEENKELIDRVNRVTLAFQECIKEGNYKKEKAEICMTKFMRSAPFRLINELYSPLMKKYLSSFFADEDGKVDDEKLNLTIARGKATFQQCSEEFYFQEHDRYPRQVDRFKMREDVLKTRRKDLNRYSNRFDREFVSNWPEISRPTAFDSVGMIKACMYKSFLFSLGENIKEIVEKSLSSTLDVPEEQKEQLMHNILQKAQSCMRAKGLVQNGLEANLPNLTQLNTAYYQLNVIENKIDKAVLDHNSKDMQLLRTQYKDQKNKIDQMLKLSKIAQEDFVESLQGDCTIKVAFEELIRFKVMEVGPAKELYETKPYDLQNEIINPTYSDGYKKCMEAQEKRVDAQLAKRWDFHGKEDMLKYRLINPTRYQAYLKHQEELNSDISLGNCMDLIMVTAIKNVFYRLRRDMTHKLFFGLRDDFIKKLSPKIDENDIKDYFYKANQRITNAVWKSSRVCFNKLYESAINHLENESIAAKIREDEMVYCMQKGAVTLAGELTQEILEAMKKYDSRFEIFKSLLDGPIIAKVKSELQQCFQNRLEGTKSLDEFGGLLEKATSLCFVDTVSFAFDQVGEEAIATILGDTFKDITDNRKNELSQAFFKMAKEIGERKFEDLKDKIENEELSTEQVQNELLLVLDEIKKEGMWYLGNQLVGDVIIDQFTTTEDGKEVFDNNAFMLFVRKHRFTDDKGNVDEVAYERFVAEVNDQSDGHGFKLVPFADRPKVLAQKYREQIFSLQEGDDDAKVLSAAMVDLASDAVYVMVDKTLNSILTERSTNPAQMNLGNQIREDAVHKMNICMQGMGAYSKGKGLEIQDQINFCISHVIEMIPKKLRTFILEHELFPMFSSIIKDPKELARKKVEVRDKFYRMFNQCFGNVLEKLRAKHGDQYIRGSDLDRELEETNNCVAELKIKGVQEFGSDLVGVAVHDQVSIKKDADRIVKELYEQQKILFAEVQDPNYATNFMLAAGAEKILLAKVETAIVNLFNFSDLSKNVVRNKLVDQVKNCSYLYSKDGLMGNYSNIVDQLESSEQKDAILALYRSGAPQWKIDEHMRKFGITVEMDIATDLYKNKLFSCLFGNFEKIGDVFIDQIFADYQQLLDTTNKEDVKSSFNNCFNKQMRSTFPELNPRLSNLEEVLGKEQGFDLAALSRKLFIFGSDPPSCLDTAITTVKRGLREKFVSLGIEALERSTVHKRKSGSLQHVDKDVARKGLNEFFDVLDLSYDHFVIPKTNPESTGAPFLGLGPKELKDYFSEMSKLVATASINNYSRLNKDLEFLKRNLSETVNERIENGLPKRNLSGDDFKNISLKQNPETKSNFLLTIAGSAYGRKSFFPNNPVTSIFYNDANYYRDLAPLMELIAPNLKLEKGKSEPRPFSTSVFSFTKILKTINDYIVILNEYDEKAMEEGIEDLTNIVRNHLKKDKDGLDLDELADLFLQSKLVDSALEAIMAKEIEKKLSESMRQMALDDIEKVTKKYGLIRRRLPDTYVKKEVNEDGKVQYTALSKKAILSELTAQQRLEYDAIGVKYKNEKAIEFMMRFDHQLTRQKVLEMTPEDLAKYIRLKIPYKLRGSLEKLAFNYGEEKKDAYLATVTGFKKQGASDLFYRANKDGKILPNQKGYAWHEILTHPALKRHPRRNTGITAADKQEIWRIIGNPNYSQITGMMNRSQVSVKLATSKDSFNRIFNRSQEGKKFKKEYLRPLVEKALKGENFSMQAIQREMASEDFLLALSDVLGSDTKRGGFVDHLAQGAIQDKIYTGSYYHKVPIASWFVAEDWQTIQASDNKNKINTTFFEELFRPSILGIEQTPAQKAKAISNLEKVIYDHM